MVRRPTYLSDQVPTLKSAKPELRSRFRIDHLRLVDDDGIFGSMVSPDFDGLSMSDRGALLDRAFQDPSSGLSDRERRRIKFIMTRTPAEYEAKLFWDSLDGPARSNPDQPGGDGSVAPSSAGASHRRQSDR